LLGIASFGAVRVGDVEQEVHNTPTRGALEEIASILAGVDVSTFLQFRALKYQVQTAGGTILTSDYVWLQTTSSTTPGYIKGWGWTTLTGLSGITGSAVGFCLTVTFTSTITGTLVEIWYFGGSYLATDPETGSLYVDWFWVFSSSTSLQVSSGQLITLSSTIVAGIAGASIIGTYGGYTGSITSVSVSPDFLRNVSMLFLPAPVASIPSVSGARGYIQYFTPPGYSSLVSVKVGTAQITYVATVTATNIFTPSYYTWVGSDTLYITYPTPSTLILQNTLAVYFSTAMDIQEGSPWGYTLVLTYSS